MEITHQSPEPLKAVVNIKVAPTDYQEKFDASLKKVQKTASMPGFRPGKVPTGMIRKMYGKGILADSLNNLLNDSLYKYLDENKIVFLGNPMPAETGKEAGNWETPGEFEFSYDVGLAPEFDLKLPPDHTFEYIEVSVSDEMVQNYISDGQRRYGKFMNPEISESTDILYGKFEELNEDKTVKENGVNASTTLAIEFIKDENEKKKFLGLKNGDTVIFNPATAISDQTELSAMFRITKEEASQMKADFLFTISTINRIEKAALDTVFFDKMVGEGKAANEAEFKEKIMEQIASRFTPQTDHLLHHSIQDYLVENTPLPLPDTFLKKWMQAANDKPVSDEQLEKEYPFHSRQIRWQLIIGKALEQNPGITVNREELDQYARQVVMSQFTQYGIYDMDPEKLDSYAAKLLEKDTEVRKMTQEILDHKIFQIFKSTFKIEKKKMTYEEFSAHNKEHHQHHH